MILDCMKDLMYAGLSFNRHMILHYITVDFKALHTIYFKDVLRQSP